MKLFYWLGIKFYQKVISPRKGFRCAYGKLHGSTGCSGAILETLMSKGIRDGKEDILERLDACKAAYTHLSSNSRDENKPKKKKGGRVKECAGELAEGALDLLTPKKCDIGDCGGCDISLSVLLRRFL